MIHKSQMLRVISLSGGKHQNEVLIWSMCQPLNGGRLKYGFGCRKVLPFFQEERTAFHWRDLVAERKVRVLKTFLLALYALPVQVEHSFKWKPEIQIGKVRIKKIRLHDILLFSLQNLCDRISFQSQNCTLSGRKSKMYKLVGDSFSFISKFMKGKTSSNEMFFAFEEFNTIWLNCMSSGVNWKSFEKKALRKLDERFGDTNSKITTYVGAERCICFLNLRLLHCNLLKSPDVLSQYLKESRQVKDLPNVLVNPFLYFASSPITHWPLTQKIQLDY